MYLKSLTLKGFKSFADRTHMVFDPGLTVVVGPNGSGKSNVSDAILWVLGEQSAKQLRGQAMEDVIFSGSSARPAVGVAEVTLVLDNTDHTLPIDFAEVGITRRMYRSGESEYLVNGAPSRLRDVQDILHDSGLGKDTHSIISQGKLDSVLSSRPEERRALVEEAADISKHRRRRERAERRLASMDERLAQAKVVQREVARQLRPLERQVDRARQAHELEAERSYLTTQLAVDDLRALQREYEALQARGREADAELELAQYRAEQRAAELERYQALLEQKGIFVGDLGEQRRRMQDVLGRLDSDMRLLEEKGRNMVSRLSDLRMQLSGDERRRTEATRELAQVRDDLAEVRARREALEAQTGELERTQRAAAARRNALDDEAKRLAAEERAQSAEADRQTLAYARLEEKASSADERERMLASRLEQLADTRRTTSEELDARTAEGTRLEGELEAAREDAAAREGEARERSSELEVARGREARARAACSEAEATLGALRAVDADAEATSPLAQALAEAAGAGARCRLGDLVDADAEAERILEGLLGEELAALVVDGAAQAAALVDVAAGLSGTEGRACVVARDAAAVPAASGAPGEPLLGHLRVAEGDEGALRALLGNVRVVPDAAAAVTAHEARPECTYVTPDGVVALPDGRVRVGSASGAQTGALERKRRIRELEAGQAALDEALEEAVAARASAEAALAEAQGASAAAKGEVARLSAELRAAEADRARLEQSLEKASSEARQVTRQRDELLASSADARGQVETLRAAAKEARGRAEAAAAAREAREGEHAAAVREAASASRELADARLSLATAKERERNLSSRERELDRRVADLARRVEASRASARALEVVRLRVDPLHDRYDAIRERALEWAARLKDRASLAEADSDSLKRTIGEARAASAEAASELERAREAANEAKVGLSRIEAQVQAAIDQILATGAVLDEALALPAPDDRAAAEARLEQVGRELGQLGPVNEAATEEWRRLKERADYLDEQVSDVERARASIKKVCAAIDRKMRVRYVRTFEQVDRNFAEVFGMLFPGGQAHLQMLDPSDPLSSGVEVVAQPRGKRLSKMSLMSGGERSLTALALLFAVYRVRTVPFYVFDEVEAALDDSNLSKLLDAIERLKGSTQLIVISHQRRTMEQADVLYGVSMQADGVSRVVSQRLDRATGKVVDATDGVL